MRAGKKSATLLVCILGTIMCLAIYTALDRSDSWHAGTQDESIPAISPTDDFAKATSTDTLAPPQTHQTTDESPDLDLSASNRKAADDLAVDQGLTEQEEIEYRSAGDQLPDSVANLPDSKSEFHEAADTEDAASYDYETQIYELLHNDERLSAYVLLSTDCRDVSCKISFRIENESQHDELINDFLRLVTEQQSSLNLRIDPTKQDNIASFYLQRAPDS